MFNVHAK